VGEQDAFQHLVDEAFRLVEELLHNRKLLLPNPGLSTIQTSGLTAGA